MESKPAGAPGVPAKHFAHSGGCGSRPLLSATTINMEGKKVLFIVAHPDDETLMAGGTIGELQLEGYTISVCTVASGAGARSTGSGAGVIANKQSEVFKFLGIASNHVHNLDYPDSLLTTVPHLDLVRSLEEVILCEKPNLIITHYPQDNHADHRIVSSCTLEAFRIFQRPNGETPCDELWYGEVLSSTDWNLEKQFNPNVFIHIGQEGIERKLKALNMFHKVVRSFPHPRSEEVIKGLAAIRGAQAGLQYAEAFQQVFRII